MKTKPNRAAIRRFEDLLESVDGNIALYRRGANEFFLSEYSMFYEGLEKARRDLELLGMYERCREALERAEELVKLGPENDHDAQMLLLETNRALMQASGTYEAMRRQFSAANNPSAKE
jgi:hypothetical protein